MSLLGTLSLTPPQRSALDNSLEAWKAGDQLSRLWNRDPALWTATNEHQWLGWLDIVDRQIKDVGRFAAVVAEVRRREYQSVVLLGMGGSSLSAEVLARSFGRIAGFPPLYVLDSTDPAQVRAVERRLNVAQSLFIVASKSGSTLEPNLFQEYFFERARHDGKRFYAITDPGSALEQAAQREGFGNIFHGVASIGGRYSALSDFGMVPAAAMGIEVFRLLAAAKNMADACTPWQRIEENPGALLGLTLGTLVKAGRDKVTIICSPAIRAFGAWLEQLLAESTGKEGRGIVPVDGEPIGSANRYGMDRLFVYLRYTPSPDSAQDRAVSSLEAAEHPIIKIPVDDLYQLGAEFFRWEMATAIAGAQVGINPFDQPDVESAKIATRKLTAAYEQTGALPEETPAFEDEGILFYGKTEARTLVDALRAHLSGISTGDFFMGKFRSGGYVALLAYVEMTPKHEAVLNSIRERIRDATRAATCLGFGPRYLHSTGQTYKGGPPSGVFIQITADGAEDLAIPGRPYTFGVVKAAQAQGDLDVLGERGRKVLRLHLGKDVGAGLAKLASAFNRALQ